MDESTEKLLAEKAEEMRRLFVETVRTLNALIQERKITPSEAAHWWLGMEKDMRDARSGVGET